MYYFRTRPKVDAIQFTVDQTILATPKTISSTTKTTVQKATDSSSVKASGIEVKLTTEGDILPSGPIKGLEVAEEAACESCSA